MTARTVEFTIVLNTGRVEKIEVPEWLDPEPHGNDDSFTLFDTKGQKHIFRWSGIERIVRGALP